MSLSVKKNREPMFRVSLFIMRKHLVLYVLFDPSIIDFLHSQLIQPPSQKYKIKLILFFFYFFYIQIYIFFYQYFQIFWSNNILPGRCFSTLWVKVYVSFVYKTTEKLSSRDTKTCFLRETPVSQKCVI